MGNKENFTSLGLDVEASKTVNDDTASVETIKTQESGSEKTGASADDDDGKQKKGVSILEGWVSTMRSLSLRKCSLSLCSLME